MTKKQAIALAGSKWWIGKKLRELALFQLYEKRLCMPFNVFHKAVEQSLKRPVFTHEFAMNWEGLKKELLGKNPPPTLKQILDLIPSDKRVLVVGV